jgi:thymidylate synthase (FAD)
VDGAAVLRKIEFAGRVCYKSENTITDESAKAFVAARIADGHESVIEHEKISVLVTCDRGVSHELVRHRIASYSQESTRYCNYSKKKFGGEITVIKPCFWQEGSREFGIWLESMERAEKSYFALLEAGAKPEQARSVLPNSLKTEIAVTMNLRQWRHFFKLRTSPAAHPQMRQVARMILEEFKSLVPVVFDDI